MLVLCSKLNRLSSLDWSFSLAVGLFLGQSLRDGSSKNLAARSRGRWNQHVESQCRSVIGHSEGVPRSIVSPDLVS
jgi:hypothetical protein